MEVLIVALGFLVFWLACGVVCRFIDETFVRLECLMTGEKCKEDNGWGAYLLLGFVGLVLVIPVQIVSTWNKITKPLFFPNGRKHNLGLVSRASDRVARRVHYSYTKRNEAKQLWK